MRHLAIGLVCVITGFAAAQCPSNGLTLATTGGRLGEPFTLSMTGTPNVTGLLAFDLAPGPVATPIGNVCLGLSPALQLLPFALDGLGNLSVAGIIPANPAITGFNVFMQAAAADSLQPSGYAVSNGTMAAVRPPRIHLVSPANGYQGPWGPPPTGIGKWAPYNTLTESFFPAVNMPTTIQTQTVVPDLGWMALILSNGLLALYDDTNTNVLTIPLPPGVAAWAAMGASGSTLLMLETTFAPGSNLAAYSLPSGTLLWNTPVPFGSALMTAPGSAKAYLINGASVIPIDVATGAALSTITTGPPGTTISEWKYSNGFAYVLLSGYPTPVINAIDDALQTLVQPAPVPIPAPGAVNLYAVGPGTNGTSVFVRDLATSTLLQLSATTFIVSVPAVPIPTGLAAMELSNGGTEWLMLSMGGAGAQLLVMNPASLAISTIATVPGGIAPKLGVLPSATVNKAYVGGSGSTSLVRFNTDPTTTVFPPVPIPLWSVGLRVIVD